MGESKYTHLFKQFEFKNYGPGDFSQGVKMGKSVHGLNVYFEYGTFDKTGSLTNEGLHVHDFDQIIFWLGSDINNMLKLGAETEIYLGKEKEKHFITVPTALAIPKGVPHFPGNILKMDKKFQYMEISLAPEYSSTPVEPDANADKTPLVSVFQSKYRQYIKRLLFMEKGPYFYGSNNREDSGGVFTSLTGEQSGLPVHISFESIGAAPYTFGPAPHRPHVHKFEEILLFMGPNADDLSYLGGEFECSMGKEKEIIKFNTTGGVVCPYMFPHCPLTVTKIKNPFFFMVLSLAAQHH
jgi:hypothetical protein